MFGAGKPSTVVIRGKIAFAHIPSFLGEKPEPFLVQLCLHWNFTESRAAKEHLELLWMLHLASFIKLAQRH